MPPQRPGRAALCCGLLLVSSPLALGMRERRAALDAALPVGGRGAASAAAVAAVLRSAPLAAPTRDHRLFALPGGYEPWQGPEASSSPGGPQGPGDADAERRSQHLWPPTLGSIPGQGGLRSTRGVGFTPPPAPGAPEEDRAREGGAAAGGAPDGPGDGKDSPGFGGSVFTYVAPERTGAEVWEPRSASASRLDELMARAAPPEVDDEAGAGFRGGASAFGGGPPQAPGAPVAGVEGSTTTAAASQVGGFGGAAGQASSTGAASPFGGGGAPFGGFGAGEASTTGAASPFGSAPFGGGGAPTAGQGSSTGAASPFTGGGAPFGGGGAPAAGEASTTGAASPFTGGGASFGGGGAPFGGAGAPAASDAVATTTGAASPFAGGGAPFGGGGAPLGGGGAPTASQATTTGAGAASPFGQASAGGAEGPTASGAGGGASATGALDSKSSGDGRAASPSLSANAKAFVPDLDFGPGVTVMEDAAILKQYESVKLLGSSNDSSTTTDVFLAQRAEGATEEFAKYPPLIALKVFRRARPGSERRGSQNEEIVREVGYAKQFERDIGVQVFFVGLSRDRVTIAMEAAKELPAKEPFAVYPLQQRMRDVAGVAGRLAKLDAADVIHGDLTLQHIRVKRDGSPAIVDFGGARRRSEAAQESDIWSLGALVYAMVFEGRTPAALERDAPAHWVDLEADRLYSAALRLAKTGAPADTPERITTAQRQAWLQGLVSLLRDMMVKEAPERLGVDNAAGRLKALAGGMERLDPPALEAMVTEAIAKADSPDDISEATPSETAAATTTAEAAAASSTAAAGTTPWPLLGTTASAAPKAVVLPAAGRKAGTPSTSPGPRVPWSSLTRAEQEALLKEMEAEEAVAVLQATAAAASETTTPPWAARSAPQSSWDVGPTAATASSAGAQEGQPAWGAPAADAATTTPSWSAYSSGSQPPYSVYGARPPAAAPAAAQQPPQAQSGLGGGRSVSSWVATGPASKGPKPPSATDSASTQPVMHGLGGGRSFSSPPQAQSSDRWPTPPPSADSWPTPPPRAESWPTPPPSSESWTTPQPRADSWPTPPPSADSWPTPPPSADSWPTPPPSANSWPTPPPSADSWPTPPPSQQQQQDPRYQSGYPSGYPGPAPAAPGTQSWTAAPPAAENPFGPTPLPKGKDPRFAFQSGVQSVRNGAPAVSNYFPARDSSYEPPAASGYMSGPPSTDSLYTSGRSSTDSSYGGGRPPPDASFMAGGQTSYAAGGSGGSSPYWSSSSDSSWMEGDPAIESAYLSAITGPSPSTAGTRGTGGTDARAVSAFFGGASSAGASRPSDGRPRQEQASYQSSYQSPPRSGASPGRPSRPVKHVAKASAGTSGLIWSSMTPEERQAIMGRPSMQNPRANAFGEAPTPPPYGKDPRFHFESGVQHVGAPSRPQASQGYMTYAGASEGGAYGETTSIPYGKDPRFHFESGVQHIGRGPPAARTPSQSGATAANEGGWEPFGEAQAASQFAAGSGNSFKMSSGVQHIGGKGAKQTEELPYFLEKDIYSIWSSSDEDAEAPGDEGEDA